MRKRYIKSVAHWVIMSIVLLFPILMVGISSFAQKQQEINVTETYEYQTNEVNSLDDLVVGNIYHYVRPTNTIDDDTTVYFCNADMLKISFSKIEVKTTTSSTDFFTFRKNTNNSYYIYGQGTYTANFFNIPSSQVGDTLDFYFVLHNTTYLNEFNIVYISASDYLGEKSINYNITDQTMRDDVNEWCSSFRNLPVNQWYGEMLDTIGLGITNSMMMNVIYTYPLYVLWVYIIDLLVDCLLVIINFGHNALKRLGGDNE